MAPRKYRSDAAGKEARKDQNRKAQRRFRANQRTLSVTPQLEDDGSWIEEATNPRANAQALLERIRKDIQTLIQLSQEEPSAEFESYLAEQWNEVQSLVYWRRYPPCRPRDAVQLDAVQLDAVQLDVRRTAACFPIVRITDQDGDRNERLAPPGAFHVMRQMLYGL
ncbi:hypothetical protein DM02DRAFT_678711 [Periconia macrospinosa]|uniref:BZIP domain-containing protein n=1 Tax=Periconia macrospinosa TaxID=97972 RepID=A0A2V1CYC9_9PLEO|nr:hypothetical protein DM02DRAFT_678711 [Periconia macrospinosa]